MSIDRDNIMIMREAARLATAKEAADNDAAKKEAARLAVEAEAKKKDGEIIPKETSEVEREG